MAAGLAGYFYWKSSQGSLGIISFSGKHTKTSTSTTPLEAKQVDFGFAKLKVSLPVSQKYDSLTAKPNIYNNRNHECTNYWLNSEDRSFEIIAVQEGCDNINQGMVLYTDINKPNTDKDWVQKSDTSAGTTYAFTDAIPECTNKCEEIKNSVGLLRFKKPIGNHQSIEVISNNQKFDQKTVQTIVNSITF